eukprot:gene12179-biopygen3452
MHRWNQAKHKESDAFLAFPRSAWPAWPGSSARSVFSERRAASLPSFPQYSPVSPRRVTVPPRPHLAREAGGDRAPLMPPGAAPAPPAAAASAPRQRSFFRAPASQSVPVGARRRPRCLRCAGLECIFERGWYRRSQHRQAHQMFCDHVFVVPTIVTVRVSASYQPLSLIRNRATTRHRTALRTVCPRPTALCAKVGEVSRSDEEEILIFVMHAWRPPGDPWRPVAARDGLLAAFLAIRRPGGAFVLLVLCCFSSFAGDPKRNVCVVCVCVLGGLTATLLAACPEVLVASGGPTSFWRPWRPWLAALAASLAAMAASWRPSQPCCGRRSGFLSIPGASLAR